MKKPKNILLAALTAISAILTALLIGGFDGLLSRIGVWCGFSEAAQYQNAAFVLSLFSCLCCLATLLLVPVALTKLQYRVTYPAALSFVFGRYGLTYIMLPFFVMRFVGVDKWLPYIINDQQLFNPLYHETLWRECAEWGSLLTVLVIIFWGCLMVMNLFGSLRYGYIAVNIASLLCLLPMLYLTLDYTLSANAQNLTLTALLLASVLGALYGTFQCMGQKIPPLRPFFAQADDDDLFWRKKREKERKWHDYRDM